jgi:hypothetical protein
LTGLWLLLFSVLFQGPPRNGVIEGFVVRAGTDPPVPLVNARLELTAGSDGIYTRTDSTGRFAFSMLPAGRFRLRVTKDGFIRQEYPNAAMDKPGLPINLGSGQELKGIVFRLDPAPTITGQIRDSRGDPVSGALVQALKRGYNLRGSRTLSVLASTKTDDRGGYRLYWLDPGEYFVSAVPPSEITSQTASSVPLPPAYFPGYPDMDDAKPVQTESGRDANGIDFALSSQTLMTISGFAFSLTASRPVDAAITLAAPADGAGVARYQTRSTLQGAFSIPKVAPGSYILSAAWGNDRMATRIRVRGGDMRVNVELGPGVAIRGRVANASGSPMDLRTTRIALEEVDTSLTDPEAAPVAIDGTFSVSAVQPGSYTLSVAGLPTDLYLKGAAFAGSDVLEKPLSVFYRVPGELQVQIGTDGGRIAGAVLNRSNLPVAAAQVTLVPESESRSRIDRYRTAVSESDGSFVIQGIAPGEYKLFAWENLDSNAYLNVDYMRSYENLGTPVRVEPGSSASVPLGVIQAER